MSSVIWTKGVDRDIQEIYERLDMWEEGTGDTFYTSLLRSVTLLEAFPEIGKVVFGKRVRRVLVFNRNYGL